MSMNISRTQIAKRIESAMDRQFSLASRATGRKRALLKAEVEGMDRVGLKLGIRCYCVEGRKTRTTKYRATDCRCEVMTTARRRALGIRGLEGTSILSGSGCRDSKGRFVPVSQCTGRSRRKK